MLVQEWLSAQQGIAEDIINILEECINFLFYLIQIICQTFLIERHKHIAALAFQRTVHGKSCMQLHHAVQAFYTPVPMRDEEFYAAIVLKF